MKRRPPVLFMALSLIAVLSAIVLGFFVIGSPGDVRMRRLDQQRALDLAAMSSAIVEYRRTRENLPASLDELQSNSTGRIAVKDPAGTAYEYRRLNTSEFELCATFDKAADLSTVRRQTVFEDHAAGRQCFARQAR